MSASKSDQRSASLAAPWWITLAGIIAACAYSHTSLSHDNSWYLIATRQFMNGAKLYVDIIEINPPLAFCLTTPGLALADFVGSSDATGYVIYVSAIATIANLWAASIVQRSALAARRKSLLFIAAPLTTLLLPIAEFGQREHLLLAFSLPYFYAATLGSRVALPKAEQAAIGLFAVFGFALKPYFYTAPLALAVWRVWREREIRSAFSMANIVIALATLAYLLVIWSVHRAYIAEIVPIASMVYHSYGLPVWKRLAQPAFFALPFLAALLVSKRLSGDDIAQALAVIAAGFVASYLVQFKGFNYHILPASAYLLLAVGWLAFEQKRYLRSSLVLATLTIAAIVGTLGHQLLRGPYVSWSSVPFARFVPKAGMGVLVISSNVSAAFPFTNDVEGRWASRYPAQWFIPGSMLSLEETDCSAMPKVCEKLFSIQQKARTDLVDDIEKRRPQVVFVDEWEQKPHFRGMAFDFVDFLSVDPRFDALWRGYERVGKTHGFRVYRLRTEASPLARSELSIDRGAELRNNATGPSGGGH